MNFRNICLYETGKVAVPVRIMSSFVRVSVDSLPFSIQALLLVLSLGDSLLAVNAFCYTNWAQRGPCFFFKKMAVFCRFTVKKDVR